MQKIITREMAATARKALGPAPSPSDVRTARIQIGDTAACQALLNLWEEARSDVRLLNPWARLDAIRHPDGDETDFNLSLTQKAILN